MVGEIIEQEDMGERVKIVFVSKVEGTRNLYKVYEIEYLKKENGFMIYDYEMIGDKEEVVEMYKNKVYNGYVVPDREWRRIILNKLKEIDETLYKKILVCITL